MKWSRTSDRKSSASGPLNRWRRHTCAVTSSMRERLARKRTSPCTNISADAITECRPLPVFGEGEGCVMRGHPGPSVGSGGSPFDRGLFMIVGPVTTEETDKVSGFPRAVHVWHRPSFLPQASLYLL